MNKIGLDFDTSYSVMSYLDTSDNPQRPASASGMFLACRCARTGREITRPAGERMMSTMIGTHKLTLCTEGTKSC